MTRKANLPYWNANISRIPSMLKMRGIHPYLPHPIPITPLLYPVPTTPLPSPLPITPIPTIPRTKYVTQLISLVVGAPASNVIAMFGMEFYRALGPLAPEYSTQIYGTYLSQAGFSPDIIAQKCAVFRMYSDADASPEVFSHSPCAPLHPDLLYPLNVKRPSPPLASICYTLPRAPTLPAPRLFPSLSHSGDA